MYSGDSIRGIIYCTLGYVSDLCRCLCSPYEDEKEGFTEIEEDIEDDEDDIDVNMLTFADTPYVKGFEAPIITIENEIILV